MELKHVLNLVNRLLASSYLTVGCCFLYGSNANSERLQHAGSSEALYTPLTEVSALPVSKRNEIEPIFKAAFSADFRNSNCTGTFITNEGHFITADHCIKSCISLPENWEANVDYKKIEIFNGIEKESWDVKNDKSETYLHMHNLKDKTTGERIDFKQYFPRHIPESVFCNVEINGEIKRSKFLVAGKGRLSPFNSTFSTLAFMKSTLLKSIFMEYEELGAGWPRGDFAVLKITDNTKTACLQLGNRLPRKNEYLKAISYTCISTPSKPENSKGSIPLLTEGIVATPDMFKNGAGNTVTEFHRFQNSFYSNMQAFTCSSGSSVVGENDTILGVMSMGEEKDNARGPNTNLIHITSVVEISEAIKDQLGYELNCSIPLEQ